MTIIEKIKAEIERRIKLHDSLASNAESEMIANLEIGAAQALDDILPFLSTLESEHLADARKISPKDLEEAADGWYEKCPFPKSTWWDEGEEIKLTDSRETFIAAAKWQKEQIMKDAVCYIAQADITATRNILIPFIRIGYTALSRYGIKIGDKVRIIIVKED